MRGVFGAVSPSLMVLAALATWRVTHLLWGEDGPGEVFARLRKIAGQGVFGRLLDCFYCLSLWVAAPIAALLAGSWPDCGLIWLALSGAAILMERATADRVMPPPALWLEDTPHSPQSGDAP